MNFMYVEYYYIINDQTGKSVLFIEEEWFCKIENSSIRYQFIDYSALQILRWALLMVLDTPVILNQHWESCCSSQHSSPPSHDPSTYQKDTSTIYLGVDCVVD